MNSGCSSSSSSSSKSSWFMDPFSLLPPIAPPLAIKASWSNMLNSTSVSESPVKLESSEDEDWDIFERLRERECGVRGEEFGEPNEIGDLSDLCHFYSFKSKPEQSIRRSLVLFNTRNLAQCRNFQSRLTNVTNSFYGQLSSDTANHPPNHPPPFLPVVFPKQY